MNVEWLLAHHYKIHSYRKEALIYSAGAKPLYVYFIVEGQVKMVTSNAEGEAFIQGIFTDGDFFGEPALILNKAYLADTIAMEATKLIKVNSVDFLSFFKDADFALSLSKVLSERLFYKSMMLEEVANENAEHRLLTLIHYLTAALAANEPLAATRQQLADMTGLRVETVIRTIKILAANKMIRVSGSKIFKS